MYKRQILKAVLVILTRITSKAILQVVLQIRSLSALAAAISFATGILNLLKAHRAETLTILIVLIYVPKRFGSQLTVSQVVLSWIVARLKKIVVV